MQKSNVIVCHSLQGKGSVSSSLSPPKGYVSKKCATHLTNARVMFQQSVLLIFPRQELCFHKVYHLSVRGKSSVSTKCATDLPEANVMCPTCLSEIRALCPQNVPLAFPWQSSVSTKCTTHLPQAWEFYVPKVYHSSLLR